MDFPTAIKTCLSKFAVFNGRASRSEYWFFILFSILASMAIGVVDFTVFPKREIHPLGAILLIFLLLPYLGVTIRRLHDTNHSGWELVGFLLIFVVAGYLLLSNDSNTNLVGVLLLLGTLSVYIYSLASIGILGPNQYGKDPLTSSSALDPQQKSPENEKIQSEKKGPDIEEELDIEEEFGTIINYSEKIKCLYRGLGIIPFDLISQFKRRVVNSKDPIADAEYIARDVEQQHQKYLAPFENASANNYMAQLRNELGDDAARRFEVVYLRLGPSADPFEIFSKIKKE